MDRVALVAWFWFIGWTGLGWIVGRMLEVPGTFTVGGFVLGLLLVFTWPWVLPERLNRWMSR
jgi:hypothetical protein